MAWILAAWLGAAALQAVPVANPPSDVTVTGKAKKKICERSSTLGSIIPVRVCKTPEEWEEIRERALAAVQQMQQDQLNRQNAERIRAKN